MKSIKSKFITLILCCVVVCVTVIGGAGVINSKQVIDDDSARIMNLMCSEKAGELDAMFSRIEQSVNTLARYTMDQLDSVTLLQSDDAYVAAYTEKLKSVAVNAADNTEGAIAVYVRFNPAFTRSDSGLFWSRTHRTGIFRELVPTDFSRYSPTDVERVGWYYIPVKNGKPTWMSPYENRNIGVKVISYVIPIYKDNVTVGVVGMDIDFELISEGIADMKVYDDGYAFLADDQGKILYHPNQEFGTSMKSEDVSFSAAVEALNKKSSGNKLFSYQLDAVEKRLAFRSLSNGMRLAITAPVAEIDASKNLLLHRVIVAGVLILLCSILFTFLLTRRITKPLLELTDAAGKIAEGDLGVTIDCQSKDEVGILADSFRRTVEHLQEYIDFINGLAFRDSLTGVKNKTAYHEKTKRLETQMQSERPEFAVMVLDINDLKRINDTYGHDFGDMAIIAVSRIICKVFEHSPVYRIGGDEFVVILEGGDLERYAQLLTDMEEEVRRCSCSDKPEEQVSVARGVAVYDPELDLAFSSVFKRADEAMYENKAMLKSREG